MTCFVLERYLFWTSSYPMVVLPVMDSWIIDKYNTIQQCWIWYCCHVMHLGSCLPVVILCRIVIMDIWVPS